MDEERLLEILVRLPAGVTEIYLHPAMALDHAIAPSMANYRHADEFAALMSWRIRAALVAANISCGGYSDALREFGGYARSA
jgi:chitin disaccharide deacetylase